MKKSSLIFIAQLCFACLHAQSPADTLFHYPNGQFLIKNADRYELRDNKNLVEWWETMSDYISLNNKSYHLIKRNGKTGLFQRKEGILIIPPAYEQIGKFLQSGSLVRIKGDDGFFVYSIKTGNKTRTGFQTYRLFGNDCLAFNEWGMFIYNEQLQLTDSIGGACQPASQVSNGISNFMFLRCKEQNILIDGQYHRSIHNDWKDIVKMEGNLLLVESEKGQGIYHVAKNRLLTSLDHTPYLNELHEARFMLFKDSSYILYDTTGKVLAKVKARGMSCVENLSAFFYLQDNLWKIMNAEGKVLQSPAFDDFDQNKAPVRHFIARTKGETKRNRYAWVYTESKGQKKITGIRLLGEYKENEPYNWPPDQPVPDKQGQ